MAFDARVSPGKGAHAVEAHATVERHNVVAGGVDVEEPDRVVRGASASSKAPAPAYTTTLSTSEVAVVCVSIRAATTRSRYGTSSPTASGRQHAFVAAHAGQSSTPASTA
eukprot:CAMPEP_0170147204 /NCGR_PEP_ID=MMETSP0033_2-20121228/33518_1 /TAXON_ID=195969 /ORGANISM="Dolichomastix tenuilepis, Strain CCMP3274" /LENGTH=109 /DNA_ID=CAMNT_0010383991 /DNA_START=119 /DNA_END=445 /DNA_ORIENTATION=-